MNQEVVQKSEITQKTGHLGAQGHPWGTEVIGVSGIIRGPWGIQSRDKEGRHHGVQKSERNRTKALSEVRQWSSRA